MNKLDSKRRAQVISCLIEGCSIRSTVRITGVAKKTVMRLLVEVGETCARYQDKVFKSLSCRRLQVDELWAFCYCKKKNVTPKIATMNPHAGDVWLWVAIDAANKARPMLAHRSARCGNCDRVHARPLRPTGEACPAYDRWTQGVRGSCGRCIRCWRYRLCTITEDLRQRSRGREALQSSSVYRGQDCGCVGKPRPRSCFHFLYRAPESFRANDHASIHAIDERLFKEDREPCGSNRAELFCVQLHQDPRDIAYEPCHGRWRHASALGSARPSCAARSRRAEVGAFSNPRMSLKSVRAEKGRLQGEDLLSERIEGFERGGGQGGGGSCAHSCRDHEGFLELPLPPPLNVESGAVRPR